MEKKVLVLQDREYSITPNREWFDLKCDGSQIARLVSEEECRRVIWNYWVALGVNIPFIEDKDFTLIE